MREKYAVYDSSFLEEFLVPTYMPSLPKDPKGNKYYYAPLKKNDKFDWYLLAIQMETPKYCNLDVYSFKELKNVVESNNFDANKLKSLINTKKSINKGWCFYVVIN